MTDRDVYVNRYYISDDIINEYVRGALLRPLFLPGFTLSVLSSAMLIYSSFSGAPVMSAVFGVCLFLLVCVLLLTPPLAARQLKDTANHIHGGKHVETVITFKDDILITEGSFSITIEYAQILHVHHLKHCSALMFGRYNGVIITQDGFAPDTFEDFKIFLSSKLSRKA